MLKLSRLTDYAVAVLVHLGQRATKQTAGSVSAAIGVPEPTVAKILKALAAAELVTSQRGPHGGYQLNRDLAAIPVAHVIAAIDGPIALTECTESDSNCVSQNLCPMKGRWDFVNQTISSALSSITLADMQGAAPTTRPLPHRLPITVAG